MGELNVIFHYICVSDIFNLLLPFLSAAYFEGVFPYSKIRYREDITSFLTRI